MPIVFCTTYIQRIVQVFTTKARFQRRLLMCEMRSLCLDLTKVMASLTETLRQDECVQHALRLREAWTSSNYKRFFQLYQKSPRMAGYLIDKFAERERKEAIKRMTKAYV